MPYATLYKDVASDIEDGIFKGFYPVAEPLPSILNLAAFYQINPNTMQKALQYLLRTGQVIKRRADTYCVTGDTDMIMKQKELIMKKCISNFEEKMSLLGYAAGEIILLIKEYPGT